MLSILSVVVLIILAGASYIDIQTRTVPHVVLALLLGVVLGGLCVEAEFKGSLWWLICRIGEALCCLLVLLGSLSVLRYVRLPGVLGSGDIKLLTVLTLWMGLEQVVVSICVAGVLMGGEYVLRMGWFSLKNVALKVGKREIVCSVCGEEPYLRPSLRDTRPFVPFLFGGSLVVWTLVSF